MINKNTIAKFISKYDNIVFLTIYGSIFWLGFIGIMLLLSIDSFSLVWLGCFACMCVPFGLSCYRLGDDGIKKVIGCNWIEKKFNIDLTEE